MQPNIPVMHQVVTAQLAAARSGTQSTKTRAEVSGGGAKPFKQKGTGRARQGSTRAPHFTGGGVALARSPEVTVNGRPARWSIWHCGALFPTGPLAGQVVVVEAGTSRCPSTKAALAALSALGITGQALIVLSRDDERAFKSFRNLTEVDIVLSGELAAYDVLCTTRSSLPARPSRETAHGPRRGGGPRSGSPGGRSPLLARAGRPTGGRAGS